MVKICKDCGCLLKSTDNFCTNCGISQKKEKKIINKDEVIDENMIEYSSRNKGIACVLALFLGTLGIHNFYLKYYGRAIAQLLLLIFSFGVLSSVIFLWNLAEIILILTGTINKDGTGKLLS